MASAAVLFSIPLPPTVCKLSGLFRHTCRIGRLVKLCRVSLLLKMSLLSMICWRESSP